MIKKESHENLATVKFADSYFSRFKGLMFKKSLNHAFILKPMKSKINKKVTSAIHTCFMKINIDVLFLDENKEIFEIISLKPWKFYTPKMEANYIIELKEGSIEKYKINVGDKLDFVCEFV